MPAKMKNILNKTFGRLTVVEGPFRVRRKTRLVTYWKASCYCNGNIKMYKSSSLLCEETKSCGCLKKEKGIEANTKHGMSHTPEYLALQEAIQRCYNTKSKYYHYYGGRGITVSERYYKNNEVLINNLIEDVGKRPSPKHSIDRIDNDGSYVEGNLKWSTQTEQNNNRRPMPHKYGGETICRVISLHKEGLSSYKISEKIKSISPQTVRRILAKS